MSTTRLISNIRKPVSHTSKGIQISNNLYTVQMLDDGNWLLINNKTKEIMQKIYQDKPDMKEAQRIMHHTIPSSPDLTGTVQVALFQPVNACFIPGKNEFVSIDGRGWHHWQIDRAKMKKITSYSLPRSFDCHAGGKLIGFEYTHGGITVSPDGTTVVTANPKMHAGKSGCDLQYWPLDPPKSDIERPQVELLGANLSSILAMAVDLSGTFLAILNLFSDDGQFILRFLDISDRCKPKEIINGAVKLKLDLFNRGNMRGITDMYFSVDALHISLCKETQQILTFAFPEFLSRMKSTVETVLPPRELSDIVLSYMFQPSEERKATDLSVSSTASLQAPRK